MCSSDLVAITPVSGEFTMPSASDESIRYVNRISRTKIAFDGITVRAPFRFFRPQDAIASRPGHIVHGNAGAGRGSTGRLAHQLQGQWIVSVPNGAAPPEGQPIIGELHLLITIDAMDIERRPNGLVDRAAREIGAAYEAIRGRLGEAPASPPEEDFFTTSGTSPSSDNGF